MLTALLRVGERLTFVGGKGGVGKTTIAAAMAIELASDADWVLVVSTDPAHSLGDALETKLEDTLRPVPGVPGLAAAEVAPERQRLEFLRDHGPKLRALLERGTYLDRGDLERIDRLVMPGLDEIAAVLYLSNLERRFDGRIIVDTAPTGHTLRVLELPGTALVWLDALETLEAKHAAVVSSLVGHYSGDEATRWLTDLRGELERFAGILRDSVSTRFVLVTTAEPIVNAETVRYRRRLEELGIHVGGLIVNRQSEVSSEVFGGADALHLPNQRTAPVGIGRLRRLSASVLGGADKNTPSPSGDVTVSVLGRFQPPLDRRLYLVGGKGGVGKSTVASALALKLAESGSSPVLILSIDPAGSLAEILECESGAIAMPHPLVSRLHVRQLDAPREWSAMRDEYAAEVDAIFDGLLPSGVSAEHDKAVLKRLVDLAPPGVDELVALSEVIDLLEDRTYDALVLDTAPTGHLLRYLELPEIVLGWSHELLRLLLRYREVVPLGRIGEDVLRLARGIRSLRSRLSDPSETCFLGVAAPEELAVPETGRLIAGVRKAGLTPTAVLVNRTLGPPGEMNPMTASIAERLVAIDPTVNWAAAPALATGPRGVDRLRTFIEGWRLLAPDSPS